MEQLIQRLLLRCVIALGVLGIAMLALGTAGGFAVAGIYEQFFRTLGPAAAAWATAGVLVLVVLILLLVLALALRRRRPRPVPVAAAAPPGDPLFAGLIDLLPARPRDRLILAVVAGALLGASSELRALAIAGLLRGRATRPPPPPPL